MAVTYFEPIPVLKGEKARSFVEKANNPVPIVLSNEEVIAIKEILEFSGYNANGTSKE